MAASPEATAKLSAAVASKASGRLIAVSVADRVTSDCVSQLQSAFPGVDAKELVGYADHLRIFYDGNSTPADFLGYGAGRREGTLTLHLLFPTMTGVDLQPSGQIPEGVSPRYHSTFDGIARLGIKLEGVVAMHASKGFNAQYRQQDQPRRP